MTSSRPFSPKRERNRRVCKDLVKIDGPISQAPGNSAIDIEAWIHRPIEVRRAEIGTGKQPGKIKRPLNAFMLYRKAYQNRAKDLWKHRNHQIISQMCGKSWNLESESIRNQFNAWAKIEREKHQEAHPSYKFTPARSSPVEANKPTKRDSKIKRGRKPRDNNRARQQPQQQNQIINDSRVESCGSQKLLQQPLFDYHTIFQIDYPACCIDPILREGTVFINGGLDGKLTLPEYLNDLGAPASADLWRFASACFTPEARSDSPL